MKIKRIGTVLMMLGTVLILASMALTIYNRWDDKRAADAADSIVSELTEKIPPAVPIETQPQESQESEPVPDYVNNPQMEMPVVEMDGYDYIGVLSIPSLELELPVMSQWSYPALKISPCRYTGSAYLNNLVIAAHNYTWHFGSLSKLSPGDQITFTDADGNLFQYTVGEILILEPTEIETMCNSEWPLSLFTCTYGGRTRLTVRAELVE